MLNALSVCRPTLGPQRQQQQVLRQRVLDWAGTGWEEANLLASVEGVDADTVRAVFFAELRSVLAAAPTAAS